MKRIVVMGGSFNPPTLAHFKLMKAAVDAVDAETGFFVPVSDAYLKRKMRDSHPPIVLSPELRIRMLAAMCGEDSRLKVCEKEIGTIEARTMPTLTSIQEDNPDAEIFSVMGADKMDLITHLSQNRDLLERFRIILYSRDNKALEQTLKNSGILDTHPGRIVVLPQPEGTEDISSSKVRERMLAGKPSQDLLNQGVWNLFKDFKSADFPDAIISFKNEYAFHGNRFPCRFEWEGITYNSAEAAFQASKCTDTSVRRMFAGCSPDKAATKGKELVPYQGWEERQLEIMESVLKAKFAQNPDLMQKLLGTGGKTLTNGNNKKETFWGVDLYSWLGENHLGKIIMNIRNNKAL